MPTYCACGCKRELRKRSSKYAPGHNRSTRFTKPDYTVEAGTGCWVWNGPLNPSGYPSCISVATPAGNRSTAAHRAYYIRAKGPIPLGLQLDHLCRNRACVNPDHLEAVTSLENTLRGAVPVLTPLKVSIAKFLFIHADGLTVKQVADCLGVSRETLVGVAKNRSWKHVPPVKLKVGAP